MPLYTLGYAARGSDGELARLMADPGALLIDIRFVPRSRLRPQWNKAALAERYGSRYRHLRGLGNVNYRHPERGIQLADPATPLLKLRGLLHEGASLVLLCACASYQRCHRHVVCDLLTASLQAPAEEGACMHGTR